MSGGVLLDERIVAVQPSLVRAFGLNCAVVVQQIHFHRGNTATNELDGHQWVKLPYEVLSDETGLSVRQLRGAVEKLETESVLISTQPEHWDRTKWYRIDYQHDRFAQLGPTAETGVSKRPNRPMTSARIGASPLSEKQEYAQARTEDETRTARAQQQIREKGMASIANEEPASPRTLEHIAEIRRQRHEVRA